MKSLPSTFSCIQLSALKMFSIFAIVAIFDPTREHKIHGIHFERAHSKFNRQNHNFLL